LAPALSLVLAENPHLQLVLFCRIFCARHGSFRVAAADDVTRTCPVCNARASYRPIKLRGATKRTLPHVESWRFKDVAPFTPAEKVKLNALLRKDEPEQIQVTPCRKKGKQRNTAISAACGAGRHSYCHCVECPCRCHAAVPRENKREGGQAAG
jgi:hypothetical protein